MKVTQEMREAFGKAVWINYPDTIRVELEPEEIDAGLQAVLNLIEREYVPVEALKFNDVMVRRVGESANDRAAVFAVLSCVREKVNALSGDPA